MHRGTPSPRSTVSPNKQRSSGTLRRRDGSVLPSSVPCPRVVSRVVSRCPRVSPSRCEKFLYGFQGGPPGRSRRRHGAHAVAPAGAPTTAAPTPVGWRDIQNIGPLDIQHVSSVRAGVPAPATGLSGAGQNPSRPSVTAGQPHPSSCLVNVHAKTALTEPARTRRWQLSEAGIRVTRVLTLNTATAIISTGGLTCEEHCPRERARSGPQHPDVQSQRPP